MKRFYSLLFALVMSANSLSAQNVTSKEFNDIKRSKQYFYYDVTMEKEEEAKNAANINLAKLISDYCAKHSITNVKVKEAYMKNVDYLRMDKNGMVRVLAYVNKAIYIDGSDLIETTDVADNKTKNNVAAVVKKEPKSEPVAVKPAKPTEPAKPMEPAKPAQSAKPAQPAKPAEPAKENKIKQEVKIPSSNHPSPEVASLAKNEAAASLTKWQQDVLEDLSNISSAEKLVIKLSELQGQYKVKRFGLENDCKSAADSFWVVYDSDKNVKAILGPGENLRYNFLKGVNESLEDLIARGFNAIWFQLSK